MTARQVTRHLWHVFDGDRRVGAILRINGARDTVYQAQADGRAPDRWETCATFDDAQTVLQAIAAGCVAPDPCSCSVCAPDAPSCSSCDDAARDGLVSPCEQEERPEASHFAWLEID